MDDTHYYSKILLWPINNP